MGVQLDNGKERHNFARMPFKHDLFKTLTKYARLPFTDPKKMVKEYADLQVEYGKLHAEQEEKDKELKRLTALTDELEMQLAMLQQGDILSSNTEFTTPGGPYMHTPGMPTSSMPV